MLYLLEKLPQGYPVGRRRGLHRFTLSVGKTACLNQIGYTEGNNERQLGEEKVEFKDFGM